MRYKLDDIINGSLSMVVGLLLQADQADRLANLRQV